LKGDKGMLDEFRIDAGNYDGPVLVTGAGGCIGSWALALLTRAGVPAVAFDLTTDKRRPRLLIPEAELNRVEWLTGDISDFDSVLAASDKSRARAVVHLAALQVPFCKADPVLGAKVNVVGTVNVFEAARRLGIRRVTYASSIAAHGAMEGHGALPTLYGAYKYCNEETARVYSQDWGVHSVGLRPGIVYGVGRDQGLTSKTTVAILAAAAGRPYDIPFRGPVSWLHAGEAASAFLTAVAKPRDRAVVLDINGIASTVEDSVALLKRIAPSAAITVSGSPLPFPMDLSDAPVRDYLGDYGHVPLEAGIAGTLRDFRDLLARGLLNPENAA
jgi:nucleoside-diphosphate-sugar epimerase